MTSMAYLLTFLLLTILPLKAAVLQNGLLASSDTTGTNATVRSVTITSNTNLWAGTLNATNKLTAGGTNMVLEPGVADGSPIAILNSSLPHTTGTLVEVQNNGTSKFTFSFSGELNIGPNEGWAAFQSNPAVHITQVREIDGFPFADLTIQSAFAADNLSGNNGVASFDVAANGATTDGGSDSSLYWHAFAHDSSGSATGMEFIAEGYDVYWNFPIDGNVVLEFWPSAPDGSTAYRFGTTVSQTSGNLVEFENNGADKFTVAFDGKATATEGLASTASDVAVTIASGGWTNTFTKNATVYIDGTGLTFTVYNNAGTPVYTNAASVAHATVNLQPAGKVLITAGSGITGRATPF